MIKVMDGSKKVFFILIDIGCLIFTAQRSRLADGFYLKIVLISTFAAPQKLKPH